MKTTLGLMGIMGVLLGCGNGEERGGDRPKATVDPATIREVSSVAVKDYYRAVGTVASRTTARIGSKVMGYVVELRAKEGDTVKAGDVLVVLGSDELKARLDGAEQGVREGGNLRAEAEASRDEAMAQMNLAEVSYQRYRELMDRESVSRQEFDEVKAAYEGAKARLRRAEESLSAARARASRAEASVREARSRYEYTRIKSPVDGIVAEKAVEEGDLVVAGVPLVVVEDRAHYRLETAVDESQAARIMVGEDVGVKVDAVGEKEMVGKVSEVVPRIDSATRSFLVRVDLPPSEGLRSGMYGKAYFPVGTKMLLLVPKSALLEYGQLSSVLAVNTGGVLERRLVKTGKDYDDQVEILSGLDPGQSIVTTGVVGLGEGGVVEKRP